jgi:hypothetical protein
MLRKTAVKIIMCSLHDVHEMNAYGADHVCPSAWLNSTAAGRILIKFGMDVMSGSALKSYFHFPTISSTNMADERTCEVGLTLAPLTIGPYNDAWL